jgi:hypothetical protein
MFSGFQLVFSYELLTWQLLSKGFGFSGPRSRFELVAGVEFRFIAGAGLPHFPEDF